MFSNGIISNDIVTGCIKYLFWFILLCDSTSSGSTKASTDDYKTLPSIYSSHTHLNRTNQRLTRHDVDISATKGLRYNFLKRECKWLVLYPLRTDADIAVDASTLRTRYTLHRVPERTC